MQPQAKECLQPPGAGRGRKDPPQEPPVGAQPCPCLDFVLLASELGENELGCLSSPDCVTAAPGSSNRWEAWEPSGSHPGPERPSLLTCGGTGGTDAGLVLLALPPCPQGTKPWTTNPVQTKV